jgi:ribosomal protein S18 acetylase RimI-like enzyme
MKPEAPPVAFRRYAPADQAAVCELHKLALEDAGILLDDGPWDEDLLQIESVYLATGGEFLVGEDAGRIVVMGALRPLGRDVMEVKRMRVDPAFQRRGLGQRMLTTLEERARELGCRKLVLDTSTLQSAARALYLKNGYRETGRRPLRHLVIIDFEKELPSLD